MAELTPSLGRSAVDHDAAADAGAERQHQHVARPRPAPSRHSAKAAAFASLSTATGMPRRSCMTSRKALHGAGCSPTPSAAPGRLVDPRRQRRTRPRPRRPAGARATASTRPRGAPPATRSGSAPRAARAPRRRDRAPRRGSSSRPRRRRSRESVHGARLPYPAGWQRDKSPTASIAAGARRARSRSSGEKRPTRRGQNGRRPASAEGGARPPPLPLGPADRDRHPGPRPPRRPVDGARLPGRATRRGRRERAPPGDRRAGARDTGRPAACTKPTQILLLGTDGDRSARRAGFRRSDTIMLVRTDPDRKRISYLSIPRDLRVSIPGPGRAEDQQRVPDRRARRSRCGRSSSLTGLEVNHVAIVDFDDFKGVIDTLGGVSVDVPRKIVSNNFDCPYRRQALRDLGGLALRQGRAGDGRPAGADLLAHPRRTGWTPPTTT